MFNLRHDLLTFDLTRFLIVFAAVARLQAPLVTVAGSVHVASGGLPSAHQAGAVTPGAAFASGPAAATVSGAEGDGCS